MYTLAEIKRKANIFGEMSDKMSDISIIYFSIRFIFVLFGFVFISYFLFPLLGV